MAGTLKVDNLNADSNLALKIANTAVAFIDSTGLKMSGSNLQFSGGGTLTVAANNAIVNPTITTPTISGNTNIDSGTLFVDATNDKVGMGTTNPSQKLHITGAMLVGNGGVDEYVYFDSTQAYVGRSMSTGDVWLNAAGSQGIVFGIAGTQQMKLDGNGRLLRTSQPGFSAYRSADLTMSSGVNYVVYNTVNFNTGSNYNNSTGTFTAPVAGKYMFIHRTTTSSTSMLENKIYKNDAEISRCYSPNVSGNNRAQVNVIIVDLAANDYINAIAYDAGSGNTLLGGYVYFSSFMGYFLG